MQKIEPKLKQTKNFDIALYVCVIFLVVFGLIMIYSASMYSAKLNYNDSLYFVKKQSIAAFLGVIFCVALSFLDFRHLEKVVYLALFAGLVLLVLVFVPGLGVSNYGARRWLNLGFFTIQSSEIAKFSFILFAAYYLSKYHKNIKKWWGFLPVLAAGGLTCLLIILEPNMSITVCVGMVMLIMLFVGGLPLKYFIFLLVPAILLVPLLIIIEPYRLNRLSAFLNPWASPQGEGYQLIQSLYALGSGGWFGVGVFNSRQKYLFLPFAESDFIFGVIGEELGFVGACLILVVYFILVYRIIKIAVNSASRFGCYLASGLGAIIAVQVLVNVAVVTGSIPPTGLPLPFISSGGSSLVMFMCAIGVIQSVARHGNKGDKFSKKMSVLARRKERAKAKLLPEL